MILQYSYKYYIAISTLKILMEYFGYFVETLLGYFVESFYYFPSQYLLNCKPKYEDRIQENCVYIGIFVEYI